MCRYRLRLDIGCALATLGLRTFTRVLDHTSLLVCHRVSLITCACFFSGFDRTWLRRMLQYPRKSMSTINCCLFHPPMSVSSQRPPQETHSCFSLIFESKFGTANGLNAPMVSTSFGRQLSVEIALVVPKCCTTLAPQSHGAKHPKCQRFRHC